MSSAATADAGAPNERQLQNNVRLMSSAATADAGAPVHQPHINIVVIITNNMFTTSCDRQRAT